MAAPSELPASPADDAGFVSTRPVGATIAGISQTLGSLAESFADADPAADEQRRRALRRMKAVALGFLVAATVIFLVCTWAQKSGDAPGWVG